MELKEFKLPSFQFGGSKAPAKKEAKKETAPTGISTTQLIVILTAVSLLLGAVGIWSARQLLTKCQKCSWDHYISKKSMRSPPRFAPKYIEVESLPGWMLSGRLYRLYLFKDQIIAIEYGPARHKKALRFLTGTEPVGIEQAGNEAQRIAARIAFLDQLDEPGVLELAQFDRNGVVVPRSKIMSFVTSAKTPWTLFAGCAGRLVMQTERRRFEWTFADRTAQLYAETVLRDESRASANRLTTTLKLAQPNYEVVELVTAKPARSRHRPF